MRLKEREVSNFRVSTQKPCNEPYPSGLSRGLVTEVISAHISNVIGVLSFNSISKAIKPLARFKCFISFHL